MSLEAFLKKFGDESLHERESFIRLMYYRAIVAIGRCIKPVDGCGCWVYPSTNGSGYGVVSVGGKRPSVSRLVLCCATNKPLDYGMDACHKSPLCRHRACCNPEHLFWGTHSENSLRREVEKRAKEATGVIAAILAPKHYQPSVDIPITQPVQQLT
jgi:hypothetical protein